MLSRGHPRPLRVAPPAPRQPAPPSRSAQGRTAAAAWPATPGASTAACACRGCRGSSRRRSDERTLSPRPIAPRGRPRGNASSRMRPARSAGARGRPVAVAGERVDIGREQRKDGAGAREQRQLLERRGDGDLAPAAEIAALHRERAVPATSSPRQKSIQSPARQVERAPGRARRNHRCREQVGAEHELVVARGGARRRRGRRARGGA